ncbi:hypothetical protein HAT2_00666 [Candidatus Similichlamydia laticola]|uniref:Uncharacterized protein n=1 Tax=Candidatus Similichlamydia laticola TaxID=2170265 RepID=A0A369KJN7_9BACT|nr:hypothetical protein HAT2_00666 [Candidatus Similichlamydia laticola]
MFTLYFDHSVIRNHFPSNLDYQSAGTCIEGDRGSSRAISR